MWLPATRLVASSHVKLSPARCAAPRCVRDDVTVRPEFGLPSGLRVGTLEPDDLPHCITVLLECFYKDTLTLAESEFSEEEMKKLRPTLEKINGAFTLYNRLALTQTTRLRLGRRLLSGGTWQMQPPCSLVLVAQEAESGKIVAVAELSTQPLDGKVPGDIRMPNLPWRVSRDTVRSSRSLTRAAANLSATLTPSPRLALSVTRRSVPTCPTCASRAAGGGAPCPAPPCRRLSYPSLCATATDAHRAAGRRGVAKAMLLTCEEYAHEWGYSELYLHAATDNESLLAMYKHWEYEQLPSFDQPEYILALSGREATRFHRLPLPRARA